MAITSAVILGGAGLAGSLITGNAAKQAQEAATQQAERQFNQQMARLDATKGEIPTLESQIQEYNPLKYLGAYTPEEQRVILQQASEMQNVQVDPRYKEAQLGALQRLTSMGETPFTDAERAQLNILRRESTGAEQARQASLLQEMQQRGIAGSGQELAARLSSSQSSANRQAEENDRLAAMAQARMLESLAQSGNLATSLSGQEFSQLAQKAQASDIINQFNTNQQTDVQRANVAARNASAAQALADRQRISESNIAEQRRLSELNRIAIPQEDFSNKMGIATGQNQVSAGLGNLYSNAGAADANRIASQGSAFAGLAGTLGAAALQYGNKTPTATKL